MSGSFPTWCVGVRVLPPFGAHAWIAAEGRDVDEPYPPGYHRVLLTVTPPEPPEPPEPPGPPDPPESPGPPPTGLTPTT